MKTYRDFQEDVEIIKKDVVINAGGYISVIKMHLKKARNEELYYVAENIIGTGIQNLTKEEFRDLEQQVAIGPLKVYDASRFKRHQFDSLDEFQSITLEEVNVKDKKF